MQNSASNKEMISVTVAVALNSCMRSMNRIAGRYCFFFFAKGDYGCFFGGMVRSLGGAISYPT